MAKVGRQPAALAVSGDGRRLYAFDRESQTIVVMDGRLLEVVGTLRLSPTAAPGG